MRKDSKIYIAGHTGLVGSALVSRLQRDSFTNLILASSSELDLACEEEVKGFFDREKPEYVFIAAGKSGGITANGTYPAEFIYKNIKIQCNIIHSAYISGVKKLLFIGCSCLYPKDCPQPAKEEYLLTGPFEPTNEAFSVAKLAGLKMCQAYNKQYNTNYISCIADTLYGPNDRFNSEDSHVIPALISRFHKAKVEGQSYIIIWGSGRPRRGFLYIDEFADACIFLMEKYNSSEPINVGMGNNISILELSHLVKEIVGFKGETRFDPTKPDGVSRKFLDTSHINALGWRARTLLKEGLSETYRWYLQNNY